LGDERHEINDPPATTLLGLAQAAEEGTTAAAEQGTTAAGPRPDDVLGHPDEFSHRFLAETKVFVEVRHLEHARVVDQTIEVPAQMFGEMGTCLHT
jgi:hypothetical protein